MDGPILVTGAAGFAGGHLLDHLTRAGAAAPPLVAWARHVPSNRHGMGVVWNAIDLTERTAVRDRIARLRPSAVYHCAGFPHTSGGWIDAATPLRANVMVTDYLLDALRRADRPCRVILIGSATVYAPGEHAHREDEPLLPRNPYALSKLAQEQLARHWVSEGLAIILTRPFNHTGPRQTPSFAAPSMARQIALIERGVLDPTIKVGNLGARRDLLDVRDVVSAYAALMAHGVPGTVYNIASGVAQPIAAVLEALISRARVQVSVVPERSRMRPDDTPVLLGDASRLRAATGWTQAIPFEQTMDDLLAYWRTAAAE